MAAAHHAVLRAIQSIFRLDRSEFMEAGQLLRRAVRLDPDYAAAHAWMAYWAIIAVGLGFVQDPGDVTTLAGHAAERAVTLDPLDARALAIAGHVKAYLLHDVPSALKLHARATGLNPNLPVAWTLSSWSKIYNGEHATAVRHAEMALSLSPRDPHLFLAEHALMTARFFSRQLDEVERLAETVEQNAGHRSGLSLQLATLGHLGRHEDAARCLAMLQEIDASVTVEKLLARAPLRPEDKVFYGEGLRRGGMPVRSIP